METLSKDGKENDKRFRGRFMNKLFKDKKDATTPQEDVDEFLHGPSDKLHMMPVTNGPPSIPPLARIDTASARRWPTAAEVQTTKRTRGQSSPRRSRKGLVVRFTETQPEVIGEGGDEATSPVSDISLRKRAHSHPQVRQPSREEDSRGRSETNPVEYGASFAERMAEKESFRPEPLRRTQTGFESIADTGNSSVPAMPEIRTEERLSPHNDLSLPRDRRSFADMVKDDMRSGEGQALVKGSTSLDEQLARPDSPGAAALSVTPQMEQLQINTMKNQHIPIPSPAVSEFSHPPTPNRPGTASLSSDSPAAYSAQSTVSPHNLPRSLQVSQDSHDSPATNSRSSPLSLKGGLYDTKNLTESPATLSRTGTLSLPDAAVAVGDDALREFSRRTSHLITLFRLSMEAFKPLPKCSLEELVRAGLWWFLRGRLNIESTIRDRPASPQAQHTNFFLRQQAYADLAKALWLVETVTAQFPETQLRPGSTDSTSPLADILECRQNVLSSLRKLTMSMKRNNFLPPEADDAPLTQGLDASIWVQDEGSRSLITSQRSTSILPLSEALPLGDTSRTFQYVRMFVEAMLVEEGAPQHYRFPALVTVVRGQKEQTITAVVASQDGSINMTIQADKNRGPTWEDVRWQSKKQMVEVYLPRGFILRLHLTEQNFRILWGIYDYEQQTQGMLERREGEQIIFETVLRNFQYFDQNPQASFPKEAQPQCLLRVFEKTIVQKAATGPRTLHRGYRLALNTSTKTKNLRGIDQDFLPTMPILYNFLRGDGGLPALLLKVEDAKTKYTMVATFDNVADRARLHNLVSGIALRSAEGIIAESPLQGFSVSNSEGDIKCLHSLEWQKFSFISQDHAGDLQNAKTVLSEQLRVVMYSKAGTITDRINVEPGELKIRLSVNASNELKILRQPQHDVTLAIAEASVPKDLQRELAASLSTLGNSESTRTYKFPSMTELHLFQAAMTGFVVLFDTVASSFNISRRRMVVPIYKKWDAAMTRLQVVQKEKIIQLVAFFENFTHGDCMNFTLKSTDVFETSSRGGKYSVRIVDAKFAMPKAREGEHGIDHEFVCLDMPEYPGEHDDITIVFDSEAIRDEFTKALPAPVKVASRMGSVRR
ncbi:uncharacterized protein LY89DRAFT_777792 [Mollisia scopiformis]|uniref:Uncharacterized protein n=1 Tax=Mollisia scopiformis TaxID=149040 RepID=A0A194XSN6_MOLSC|nr:uncharacterized protein LY89DRAFT_777792 [Mollisia scopiformis]KUJ22742.1 hypothetical protein LY89DRAFT_777792 [Mollisia scopiformis]